MIEQSVQAPLVAPEQLEAQEQRHLSRHRHKRAESGLHRFVHRQKFAIAWFLLVSLGAILVVVDPRSAKATLSRWAGRLLAAVDNVFGLAARLSAADMVGGLLIVLATALLLIHIRRQLMRNPSLTTGLCPACGLEIRRIHRHTIDRWISICVPVQRYRCSGRDCAWTGLRVVASQMPARRRG